ncbi:protein artichoke [Chrysoperla carnea]|uniref:protein artichoke n=1 Tax=Chrysoperla carnea TaxID=189513 RepID=UPI001D082FFF|nr:protein artichoke [Chrysoperla carnea]
MELIFRLKIHLSILNTSQWFLHNFIWFLLIKSWISLPNTSGGFIAECPAQELILPCRCLTRGNEYQIWCSHSELSNVLDGLKSIGKLITNPIDELILENNNLPSLPGRFFLPIRVMRLMLRNNYLQRVSSGWLTGLENTLMELYMVEPDLRSFPMDSLDQLRQLEAVTIKSNLMKRAPYFSGLPRLRYIQIESTSLVELSPRNFKMLPSLEKLHITGSEHLTRLESNVLEDLPQLNIVNISFNAINWVHPRAFSRLPNLVELHLIGNQITDAGMIGRGTRDLQSLTTLRLDYNNIDKIGEASFVDIPALRDLYLSYNQITDIHHGAFHQTPQLRMLNLNHNLVRHVHPESFLQHSGSGLEELWLIDNDISHVSELRSLLDALPRLIFLDMSYNFLQDIPFGALRGHPTLERLHLNHNKIQMVEREAFTAMPALRELRLKNNSLSNLLDGPLWNLPALKGLDLSQNYFKRIEPRLLMNLPSLRRLDLSENQLGIIDPASFLETPALEHVNISHNVLTTLHPATFRHLMHLYEIDVSHNRLVEFVPGLPRGIENLHMSRNQITSLPLSPSPDLDLPSLRMLDISRNGIAKIQSGSFRTLPQLRRLNLGKNSLQTLENSCLEGLTRLEVLDLHDNRLMLLHPQCLREKRELRELNLSGNHLEMLVPEVLQDTEHLKKLDVSNNRLTEIMSGTFQNTRELKSFDCSYNSLTQLPPSIRNLKNLEVLDLTNNRLRYLQPETLSSLAALTELKISRNRISELRQRAFDNLSNLKILELQDNEIDNIEPLAINSLPNLTALKLGKNKLRILPDNVFRDLTSLETAELQENQLQNIADTAFNNVPHILLLNLSSNQIHNLDDAGLRSIRSLEVLDLSNNKLRRIDNSNMAKMEWLVELKMDNNKICTIQGAPFNGMPRLRVLSLRNNLMSYIPEYTVKRLRSSIAVLDIEGNPISCSCPMLWMRAWLEEASELGPRCSDGTYLREMRLSRQDCSNTEQQKQIAVSPECESEIVDSNLYGTSQVFSPYTSIKDSTSQLGQNTAPSPEESDYFYDEYVDYPYNETSILAIEQNNSIYNNENKATPVPIITSSEKISSHFIPGDTPTIYAEPKKNSSNQQNFVQNDLSKYPSPSQSGFTFFGMPLPALNLGSLWGSGRKADRKYGLVNTSRGNGRVQMYPEYYGGSNHVHKQYTINPLPEKYPPTVPDVQTGGFVPMLPGSGGFTPMIPSSNKTEKNSTMEMNLYKNQHDFINTEISNTSDSKLTKRGPHFIGSDKNSDQDLNKVIKNNKVTITKLDYKPTFIAPGANVSEIVTERTIISTTPELTNKKSFSTIVHSTTQPTIIENVSKSEFIKGPPSSPKNIIEEIEKNVTNFSIDEIVTTKPFNDEWETNTENDFTKASSNESPSPLSALLIPGGQHPQQYKPPVGKPTITKVELASIRNISTTEKPTLIDSFFTNDDLSKDETTTVKVIPSNGDGSMSWYFKNYNQTNLEPYIGPGHETHSLSVNNLSVQLNVPYNFLIILTVITINLYR